MKLFFHSKEPSLSERMVGGLLAGVTAGAAMLGFMVLVGWMFSEPAASVISRFSAGRGPIQGALIHLSISGIYGILYSPVKSLFGRFPRRFDSLITAMTVGLIYGSFLWMINGMVLLAVEVSPFETFPQPTFAIAHLVYGVVLGMFVERSELRSRVTNSDHK